MSASVPSTPRPGGAGQSRRISVALIEERSGRRFKLTYRSETIPLENSGSLNRWAATGIVGRHNISLVPGGVMIDGKTLCFDDPGAPAELERIFNDLQVVPRPLSKPSKPAASMTQPAATGQGDLARIAKSVKVTRDGFEFHINYLTKFGEHKSERLEKALEALQKMGLFKSHVNLQKAGIRIVVTSWDGEHFFEQPGIENLEHSTPEEVEALIKRNMEGLSDGTGPVMPAQAHPAQKRVTRLDLTRKPHDARFHVIFHRMDGTTEEGPLLIRANLPKLQVEELFRPDINIVITAMNDRLIIERAEEVNGQQVKRTEVFDLKTDEDAGKVGAALNACLKSFSESAPASKSDQPLVGSLESAVPFPAPDSLSGSAAVPGLRA